MATLVQSFPSQTATITMLDSRSGAGRNMMAGHIKANQAAYAQQPRSPYQGMPGNMGAPMAYRGTTLQASPYTWANPPAMSPAAQWQAFRAGSATSVPTQQSFGQLSGYAAQPRHPGTVSMTNLSGPSTLRAGSATLDDSAITNARRRPAAPVPRPQSAHLPNTTALPPIQPVAAGKNIPDRYRRPGQRVSDGSNSGTHQQAASLPQLGINAGSTEQSRATANNVDSSDGARPKSGSIDDSQLHLRSDAAAQASRRRSMPALNVVSLDQLQTARAVKIGSPVTPTLPVLPTPIAHNRNDSADSVASSRSSRSRPSSANRSAVNLPSPTGSPAQIHGATLASQNVAPKLVQIPPRISSTDAATRGSGKPSPLSQPVTMGEASADDAKTDATAAAAVASSAPSQPLASPTKPHDSPAARQLAAVSQKGGKLRSKSSRLRRVLSFGSAADFRDSAAEDDIGRRSGMDLNKDAGPSKLQKEPTAEDLEQAEQDRVIAQQEAAGIGHSIYAGSRLFSSSTDNLSISSTASSASVMIRKMGRGMKKGGRSLVGLFRPKSVIGVAPMDAPETSLAAINVEAERERVNVNADPHTQAGGGTGFPHLERNSLDAASAANFASEAGVALASVTAAEKKPSEPEIVVDGTGSMRKKGILKRANTATPPPPSAAVDVKNTAFMLPEIPNISESPSSTAPSTPRDDAPGHKRSDSIALGNEDYFMAALRLRQDTKSAPATPQGTVKRNATFSPRIIFHDTWPPQEYDRRGEISTCNRLTPMLAQQIKEELNSFKMEMEVHETSKIYTHFF